MIIEPLAAIKLASELLSQIIQSAQKSKGTPKQQLAKNIVNMFHALKKIESPIHESIKKLEEFQAAASVEGQIQALKECKEALQSLQDACRKFAEWYDKELPPSTLIEIYAPNASKILDHLRTRSFAGIYDPMEPFSRDLMMTFAELQQSLQAVDCPNPRDFPDESFVHEVICELNAFQSAVTQFKSEIRAFALAHIAVEDFFQ